MATIKFDRILQEFSRRIGDRLNAVFVPGAGAYPNGSELDSVDSIAYINKALNKLMEDVFEVVKGDIKAFAQALPELISIPAEVTFVPDSIPTPPSVPLGPAPLLPSTTLTGLYSQYDIATPHKDFFKLFGAYVDSDTIIRIYPEDQFINLVTKNYPDDPPTEDDPCLVALNESLYLFPSTETLANIIYIKKPLLPTTGDFIAQNGEIDSPYHDHRNSRIAELAEKLYWNEKRPDAQ